jgi:hypothetical protein
VRVKPTEGSGFHPWFFMAKHGKGHIDGLREKLSY